MRKGEVFDIVTAKYGLTADRKKRYHPLELEAFLELGFNQIIYALMLNAIHHSDYSQLDLYIKPYYNVEVKCNEHTGDYYSELPAPVIQLPMNRGVRYITPTKQRNLNFIFRGNGDAEVMEELEFAKINNIPTYEVENWHIIYTRMTPEMAKEGVTMRLIVPFRSWHDDDFLPLPSSQDLSLVAMVEQLIDQVENPDLKPNAANNEEITSPKK